MFLLNWFWFLFSCIRLSIVQRHLEGVTDSIIIYLCFTLITLDFYSFYSLLLFISFIHSVSAIFVSLVLLVYFYFYIIHLIRLSPSQISHFLFIYIFCTDEKLFSKIKINNNNNCANIVFYQCDKYCFGIYRNVFYLFEIV